MASSRVAWNSNQQDERMKPNTSESASGSATVNLLGVSVAAVTREQVLALVRTTVLERGRLQIGVVNAAKLVTMRSNQLLREDVLSSDVILADGSAVVWASRLLGRPLPERVTGIDLMNGMLETGSRAGYGVYLLGATETVSRAVAERIGRVYPGVRMVGRRNGYFANEEEEGIAREIRDSRPDILLIAMSSPKKERFLARWSRHIAVPVCHGVGGSFDVFAGKVQRAPLTWQRLGLEWLYRLKQEPRRLFKRYAVTNTQFCLMTLKEMSRKSRSRPAHRTPAASS
jgi:N-acetylglucosaminyldiphosphoundecaprenol N-acetyl-beta-D-mannosaminyltransferase